MDTEKLLKLINEACGLLDEKLKANEIKPEKHVVVKFKVEEMELSESSSRVSWSDVHEVKATWSLGISNLIEERIKNLPIFNELIDSMVREYGALFPENVNRKSQSAFWLRNFLFRILYEKLENKLTQERIVELTSILVSELGHAPIRHEIKANLEGIYVDSESMELSEGVVVRKPKPSDLEYEISIMPFIPAIEHYRGIPTAILEITMFAKNDDEVQEKIERVLTILRLYRLGSVCSPTYSLSSVSVIGIGGSQQRGSGRTSVLYRYTIKDSEAETLNNCFGSLETLLPKKLLFERKATALDVTLDCYKNCLLEASQSEMKLMSAIMGLESLYAYRGEMTEIGYRLKLRVARLFTILGFDSKDVKDNIRKSYHIRSKVAHGLPLKENERKELASLLKEILNYLRISILVFASASPMEKRELISLIEESMLNASRLRELEIRINDALKKIPEEAYKKK
jgi:hypothetical protein